MTPHFDVQVDSMIDYVIRVTVCGEVDPATSETLFEVLISALSVAGIRHIAVNLANVTFLDASGIGVLLAAQNRAHAAGRELSVRAAVGMPLAILEITGVLGRLHGDSTGEDPDSFRAQNGRGRRHGR